jgi:hypothetical protein
MLISTAELILSHNIDPLRKVKCRLIDGSISDAPAEYNFFDILFLMYPRYYQGHPIFYGNEGFEKKGEFDLVLELLMVNKGFITALRSFLDTDMSGKSFVIYDIINDIIKFMPICIFKEVGRLIDFTDFKKNRYMLCSLMARLDFENPLTQTYENSTAVQYAVENFGFNVEKFKEYDEDIRSKEERLRRLYDEFIQPVSNKKYGLDKEIYRLENKLRYGYDYTIPGNKVPFTEEDKKLIAKELAVKNEEMAELNAEYNKHNTFYQYERKRLGVA